MRYLLLHCVEQGFEDHPELPTELETSLREWLAETTENGVLLDGSRLQPPGVAKTVRVRGGEVLVTDGPFAETKEQVAGYDILDCEDFDEVLAIAARHVTTRFGSIEIRPILDEG